LRYKRINLSEGKSSREYVILFIIESNGNHNKLKVLRTNIFDLSYNG